MNTMTIEGVLFDMSETATVYGRVFDTYTEYIWHQRDKKTKKSLGYWKVSCKAFINRNGIDYCVPRNEKLGKIPIEQLQGRRY